DGRCAPLRSGPGLYPAGQSCTVVTWTERGVTGKSKHLLEAWVQEYKDCKRGGDSLVVEGPAHDGRMHLHRAAMDSACAAAYVHPSGCVTPVVADEYRVCMDACW